MTADEKDFLDRVKAAQDVGLTSAEVWREPADCANMRRCIFRHDVPASQGFEVKAGFVCYGHSSEFDE